MADAADDAGLDHRADSLDDRVQRNSGFFRDHMKRMALESGDEVFGDGEDAGVDRFVVFDRDGGVH